MNLNAAYTEWIEHPNDVSYEIFGYHLYKYISLLVEKKQNLKLEMREEIVGDAVIRVLEKLQVFKDTWEASFSNFVYTIVENIVAETWDKAIAANEYPLSPTLSAPDEFHGRQAKVLLNQLVGGLSEDEKALVKLQLEGFSDQEIADKLGIPIGTVWSKWSRVQGKMKKFTN